MFWATLKSISDRVLWDRSISVYTLKKNKSKGETEICRYYCPSMTFQPQLCSWFLHTAFLAAMQVQCHGCHAEWRRGSPQQRVVDFLGSPFLQFLTSPVSVNIQDSLFPVKAIGSIVDRHERDHPSLQWTLSPFVQNYGHFLFLIHIHFLMLPQGSQISFKRGVVGEEEVFSLATRMALASMFQELLPL